MSAPIIAVFNPQSGVGKTSWVYHLAWMFQKFDQRVIAVDFDPQATLTAAFLEDERLEEIWLTPDLPNTVFQCVQPLLRGMGEIAVPQLATVNEQLSILVGDLRLLGVEDELSAAWFGCLERQERSFRIVSAFWQLIQAAIATQQADLVLMDLAPNLGAINRAALLAADYVVIPLMPDLVAVQGLSLLGPTLRRWQSQWLERLAINPVADLQGPTASIQPAGYWVVQPPLRLDRPVKDFSRWINQIPAVYREAILAQTTASDRAITTDPHCLARLKYYPSLMPLAQEARKPIFDLKPADGAIGSHLKAVQSAYKDCSLLAMMIAKQVNLNIEQP